MGKAVERCVQAASDQLVGEDLLKQVTSELRPERQEGTSREKV